MEALVGKFCDPSGASSRPYRRFSEPTFPRRGAGISDRHDEQADTAGTFSGVVESDGRMKQATLCLGLLGAVALYGADGNPSGRLVAIGDHHLYVQCSGMPSKATVVLVNGMGGSLEMWKPVQSNVERFARVCSYDRAGEGHSDKIGHLQTPDEVVNDLSRLLEAEMAPGPFILVGASLGGIHVRKFAQRFPDSTAGIVLVDSSHEEQYNRYAAISPEIAAQFATQDGRFDRNEFLAATGQLKAGEHLEWRLDVPLIVLEHTRLTGAPKTEEDRLAVAWHELQVDLAARSKFGKLIESHSGHMIASEQPELVIESIRGVIKQSEIKNTAASQR
jgi:pimeloyl-ACP methyl ester carboxylesterase